MSTEKHIALSSVAERSAHVLGHAGVGYFACYLSLNAAHQAGSNLAIVLISHCWATGIALIFASTFLHTLLLQQWRRKRNLRGGLWSSIGIVVHVFSHTLLSLGLTTVALGYLVQHLDLAGLQLGSFGIPFLVFYSTLFAILPMAVSSYRAQYERLFERFA